MSQDHCEDCQRISKEVYEAWVELGIVMSKKPSPTVTLAQIDSERSVAEDRRMRAMNAKADHEASTGHQVPKFTNE